MTRSLAVSAVWSVWSGLDRRRGVRLVHVLVEGPTGVRVAGAVGQSLHREEEAWALSSYRTGDDVHALELSPGGSV